MSRHSPMATAPARYCLRGDVARLCARPGDGDVETGGRCRSARSDSVESNSPEGTVRLCFEEATVQRDKGRAQAKSGLTLDASARSTHGLCLMAYGL